jgi:DnaK suppressor protein
VAHLTDHIPTPTHHFDALRSTLVAKREQLVATLGVAVAPVDGIAGSNGETEHLSLAEQRDIEGVIDSMQRKALTEIDEALARIEAGTYGSCALCGTEIPRERLEIVPETAVCVRCG